MDRPRWAIDGQWTDPIEPTSVDEGPANMKLLDNDSPIIIIDNRQDWQTRQTDRARPMTQTQGQPRPDDDPVWTQTVAGRTSPVTRTQARAQTRTEGSWPSWRPGQLTQWRAVDSWAQRWRRTQLTVLTDRQTDRQIEAQPRPRQTGGNGPIIEVVDGRTRPWPSPAQANDPMDGPSQTDSVTKMTQAQTDWGQLLMTQDYWSQYWSDEANDGQTKARNDGQMKTQPSWKARRRARPNWPVDWPNESQWKTVGQQLNDVMINWTNDENQTDEGQPSMKMTQTNPGPDEWRTDRQSQLRTDWPAEWPNWGNYWWLVKIEVNQANGPVADRRLSQTAGQTDWRRKPVKRTDGGRRYWTQLTQLKTMTQWKTINIEARQ